MIPALQSLSIQQTLNLLRVMSQPDAAAPAQPVAQPVAMPTPSSPPPDGTLPADLPVMVPASMAETNPGLSLAGLRPPLAMAAAAGQPTSSSASSGQASSSQATSSQASSKQSDAIAQLLEALGQPQGAGGADAAGGSMTVVLPPSVPEEGGVASNPEQSAALATINASAMQASTMQDSAGETALALASARATASTNDPSSSTAAQQSGAVSQEAAAADTSAKPAVLDGSAPTAISKPETPGDGQRPVDTVRQADSADLPARAVTELPLAPERGGIIASFILNAGMLPVRPPPLMAGAETAAAKAGTARQPTMNDEEALQFLVNLGANPALIEKMRKTLRRRPIGKKMLLFLASLMTALTVVTEALQRELESLAEEEQEKEDRESADPHGRSDGRRRLYLE